MITFDGAWTIVAASTADANWSQSMRRMLFCE